MKLLVSIHDVTPAYQNEVRALFQMCATRHLSPALLVVPDWHGTWPLEDHPRFVAWVRDRAEHGADVMLHGHRHDEVGLPRSPGASVRAFGRTAGEAEFLTLGTRDAFDRIAQGLDVFRRVGLSPIGFVPPAWLWRSEGRTAVAAAGLRVSEDDSGIDLHHSRTRVTSPVIRWSARSSWRAYASAAVARVRMRTVARDEVVRVALHPRDLAHPATTVSLTTVLDELASAAEPWRYAWL